MLKEYQNKYIQKGSNNNGNLYKQGAKKSRRKLLSAIYDRVHTEKGWRKKLTRSWSNG